MNAVAYCRYSTANQDENSIAYQMDSIQKYCALHQHVLLNIYADEAKSGYNTERDNFQRMIDDAKKGLFEAVIFYDLSRISRNVVDWFTSRELFRQVGIQLFSCSETIGDADDPASFLTESMKAIISQHFVMETRKKVIAGQASKAKEGAFLGGIAPLGYDIKEGRYEINHYEAGAVRLIFNLYADGYGYRHICNMLAQQGYKSKHGALIGVNALKPILQNERYKGMYIWNRVQTKYFGKWAGGGLNPDVVRIPGILPVIIEEKLWNEVQARMKSGARTRLQKDKTKYDYLLSGLIRCDKCGASFSGNHKKNQRGYVNRYYTCTGRLNKKGCQSKPINADELELWIVTLLKDEFFNTNLIERTADIIINKVNSMSDSRNEKIGAIKKEIADVNAKTANLLNVIMDGFESKSIREKLAELDRQKGLLEQSLVAMEQSSIEPINRSLLVKKIKKDSFSLYNEPDKLANILRKYISKIIVYDEYLEITSYADVVIVGDSGREI